MRLNVDYSPFLTEQIHAEKFADIAPKNWHPNQNLSYIAQLTTKDIGTKIRPGYRDGVLRITLPPAGWKSRTVVVNEDTIFQTTMESRVVGETPRKTTRAIVESLPDAALVEAILYNRSVLEEKDEPRSGAEWDFITILTHPTDFPAPMNVGTLMANHFGADGGSNTLMSPEAFEKALKESYDYWKDKALATVNTRAFKSTTIWARLESAGIQTNVLADAYDWAIDVEGELYGLIAGDQGYEKTGIKLNETDTKIWNMGVNQYLHSDKYLD